MQSLSKEAEQKLISAIEKAAEFVNTGMSPNDAIVKSASAANVPAGHINLMVHAYNTGRTTKQREQGEDALEKAADFQLADAKVVMDALYPAAVKTSAEIVRQQIVSTDYAVSPAGMLARRRAEQEKVAAAQSTLPEKTWVPPPREEKAAVERAYSEKRAAQLANEELRRQATAAYTKAAGAMDELAEFFRRPGNMSFPDAVKQVELRIGDDGVSVLNKVAEVYPQFKKQAATTAHHFGDNPVYGLVQRVLDHVQEYVAADAKVEKKAEGSCKKKAPEFLTGSVLQEETDFSDGITLKQAWDPATNPANPGPGPSLPPAVAAMFGVPPPAPPAPPAPPNNPPQRNNRNQNDNNRNRNDRDNPRRNREHPVRDTLIAVPQNVSDRTFGEDVRRGGFVAGAGAPVRAVGERLGEFGVGETTRAGMLANILGLDRDPDKMRGNAYKDITSPNHELTLKNIKAQATLHDLMLNDDVISGYDPREVALAFNDIAATAPNVVDAPAVLAAVLRKRLEAGQLADFDAKQLLEMEKLKAERDEKVIHSRKMEQEMV